MNTILIFLTLIFVILNLVNLSKQQSQPVCGQKGLQKFDEITAKLITIGNSGRQFPESKGEPLKAWCKDSDNYIKEMEKHKNNCFKGLSKQVFGVLIYALKNAMKQYCRKESQKLNELLAAVPCINKHNDLVTKCYTTMIDSVLGAKNAVDNKKIPHLCCEYARIFDCFNKNLIGPNKCKEFQVDAISDLIRAIIGNVTDLICGDYVEGSDKCDKLGYAPKKKRTQKRTKSFAIPVLDLLSSFPEVD